MSPKRKTPPPSPQRSPRVARIGGMVLVVALAFGGGLLARGLLWRADSAPGPAAPSQPSQVVRPQPVPPLAARGQAPTVTPRTVPRPIPSLAAGAQAPRLSESLEDRVLRVAANFRCACGGCNELPLDTCTCDMPKGAVEEKAFIRLLLQQGLSEPQVIQKVEARYGLRNS